MKKIINFIKDFFYEITDYALIIIVVVVIGLILIWRFNVLFDIDLNKDPMEGEDVPPISQEENPTGSGIESPEGEEPVEEPDEPVQEEPEQILVEIPSGTSAQGIADILMSRGLIDSEDEFIQKAIELGLDTQLKSGDFLIDNTATMEEILKTISRTN
ncbi:MAG: hypothetical protein SCJ93_06640 [Bacillota bacterium]|nr:hypothetical protein [Bacillota bacterium]